MAASATRSYIVIHGHQLEDDMNNQAPVELTSGELAAGNQRVRFTIALPEGLKPVKDELASGAIVTYRKSENDFEGYGVTVGLDRRGKAMLARGKQAILSEFEEAKTCKSLTTTSS
jgi:hypothetical protein